MLVNQNQITHAFVAKKYESPQTAGQPLNISALRKGEVVVTDLSLNVVNPSDAPEKFYIIQGMGAGKPFKKVELSKSDVVSAVGTFYSAPTQTVKTIGFNGTSGKIDVIDDNSYILHLEPNTNGFMDRGYPLQRYASFATKAAATQEQIANGLFYDMKKNLDIQVFKPWRIERLVTGTLDGNSDNRTLAVVEGSKGVTLSGAYAAATTVGNYLVIKGVAYRVVQVSGLSITLDSEYVGVTETVAAASVRVITAANAANEATVSWGLRIRSVELPFDTIRFRDWRIARFNIYLTNGGSTNVDTISGGSEGFGAWQNVAMSEFMSQGNEGQFVLDTPPGTVYSTVEEVPYNIYTIRTSKKVDTTMVGAGKLDMTLNIYVDTTGNALGAVNTALVSALNAVIGKSIVLSI